MYMDMTSNYYVVYLTTSRVHSGEHLEYYALHRSKKLLEHFGIN